MDNKNLLEHLEKLDPGIVLFGNDFSVSHINHALMLIFRDVPREELLGRDLMEMHGPKSRERLKEVFSLMKDSTRSIPFSIKRMNSGDQERFLLLKLMPLVDKEFKDSLNCCLVYDITSFITTSQHDLVKIPVTAGNGIRLIDPAEVLYLKAENIYSKVITARGEFLCDLGLGVLEEGVSKSSFYRIHRSYIVNLGKIDKIDRENGSLTVSLENCDARLPVSRTRAREFLARIGLR
ncbi:MAG: LytTR family transcriptional regulator DNA-binding domain-containing protein [Syntrophotaleaceae bacterium]